MTERTIVLPPNPGGNGADANYRLSVMVPKRRYLSYLRNRWWVLMVCVALAVGAVVTYETLRLETYSSFAQLYVTLGPQLGASIFAEPKDDFATQIELLKGSHLRSEAMDGLGPDVASKLKGSIDLEVVRPMGSSILQLKATSPDPAISQKYLQALIARYLSFKQDTRLKTAEDLVASLNDEIAHGNETLKATQEKWAEFQKTNNISLVVEDAKTEGMYLSDQKLQLQRLTLEHLLLEQGLVPDHYASATNNSVAAAINAVDVSATNTAAIGTNVVAAATNSPLSRLLHSDADLKNARLQLTLLREERRKKFEDTHESQAAVKGIDEDVDRLQRKVAVLETDEAAERQETLNDYEKRIAAIKASLPTVQDSVKTDNDLLSQAQLIKDEIQRQQSYYDGLLGLLRTVDFSKNMAQERITLLDPPSPGVLVPRSLPFRIFMATVGGLCLGLGLVFVWHMLDDRLISIHDVKDQFGEAVLGMVPQVRVAKSKPHGALLEPGDARPGYLESYRHLRSALLLSSLGGGGPQTLLFTGAVPSEGKTTVAVNLARLLARSGLRVALVDADLRGGHIHEMLDQAEGPGFLDYLRGDVDAQAVIHSTDLPGLVFVPVGMAGKHTDGILTHKNPEELVQELKTGRDYVILDSAPLLVADDASLLVPYADAVIMVVRPFYTRGRQTRRALEMLYQRQAKQVALVLNRAGAEDLAGQYYPAKRKSPAVNGKV